MRRRKGFTLIELLVSRRKTWLNFCHRESDQNSEIRMAQASPDH
ncbi:MAG: prepilin-type N-terminal cleavage/methylation domain-containing protein [Planctomycetes bacterium]|nr:prepilin-type N-terminal cleavage/methylation domain-containing protein [Planctomycetota bacterium]